MCQGQVAQWVGLHRPGQPYAMTVTIGPCERPNVLICKKCGNRNPDQEKFCTSCGAFLEWNSERVVEAAPPPPPPPPIPPPPPPPPRPETLVDRVKYVVGIDQNTTSGQGGWVPPTTVASQTATQSTAQPATGGPTTSPLARRPDQPVADVKPQTVEPQARQPEEVPVVRPQGPRVVVPVVPDTNEVGVYCSRCAAGNDTRRHFCRRCGAPLMMAPRIQVSWWERLFPRRKDPAAGDRHTFSGSETNFGSLLRTFLLTMLLVVLVGGVFAYVALPPFRQAVNSEIDVLVTDLRRLINPTWVQVHPVSTSASSEIAGHPAAFTSDLVSNDYWAADTARDPQPTLVFTFDGPTDLDALVITSGAATDFARIARPRTIQITYSDGTGETLTLKDDAQATAYSVHARQVTSMTMRITGVYAVSGNTDVAFAEVELRRLQ